MQCVNNPPQLKDIYHGHFNFYICSGLSYHPSYEIKQIFSGYKRSRSLFAVELLGVDDVSAAHTVGTYSSQLETVYFCIKNQHQHQ